MWWDRLRTGGVLRGADEASRGMQGAGMLTRVLAAVFCSLREGEAAVRAQAPRAPPPLPRFEVWGHPHRHSSYHRSDDPGTQSGRPVLWGAVLTEMDASSQRIRTVEGWEG